MVGERRTEHLTDSMRVARAVAASYLERCRQGSDVPRECHVALGQLLSWLSATPLADDEVERLITELADSTADPHVRDVCDKVLACWVDPRVRRRWTEQAVPAPAIAAWPAWRGLSDL